MSKFFNDAMLTSMSAHAYTVHEYNIVGTETNQVNRRECKFTFVNTPKGRVAYMNMLKANALNVANQNVAIDLGKHPELLKSGSPFAEYMKERRKAVYELYKLANKWVDGTRMPQADCPMYEQAEHDAIKYLPIGNAAYGKLREVLKLAPAHLYSNREYIWNDNQERWDYENHMTDYAVDNMEEVKYSDGGIKDVGMFTMTDVRDAYTEVTARDVWDGKQAAEFSLFKYTLMVARRIKELSDELVSKGAEKLDVNAELKRFFMMCVMKKFNCSEEEATAMAAKAAFEYCFTVDAKVYEETGFEMRAEKLFNLFVEDWAALQIKLGEETLNTDIELPEFDEDDEENDDDDDDLA